MAGFAENGGMHRYLVDSVRRTLFSAEHGVRSEIDCDAQRFSIVEGAVV